MDYFDIAVEEQAIADGRVRQGEPAPAEDKSVSRGCTCNECGMEVFLGEDHPFAACLMYKGCYSRDMVIANFEALKAQWIELGKKLQKQEEI